MPGSWVRVPPQLLPKSSDSLELGDFVFSVLARAVEVAHQMVQYNRDKPRFRMPHRAARLL